MNNDKDQDILEFVRGYDKNKATQDGTPKEEIVNDIKETKGDIITKDKDLFSSFDSGFLSSDLQSEETEEKVKDKKGNPIVKESLDQEQEKNKEIKVYTTKGNKEPASVDTKIQMKEKPNESIAIGDIKDLDHSFLEETIEKPKSMESKPTLIEIEEDKKTDVKEAQINFDTKTQSKEKPKKEKKFQSQPIQAEDREDKKKEKNHDVEINKTLSETIKVDNKKDLRGYDGFIALDSSVQSIEDIYISDEELDLRNMETPQSEVDKKTKDKLQDNKKVIKQELKAKKRQIKIRQEIEKRKWSTYHNNFVLAEGEKVIKDYSCLKVMNSKGPGVISVTNKRLLCSAGEMTETELDNITGLTYKYTSGFNMFRVALFLLLGAIAAFCFLVTQDILLNLTELWATKPSWFNIVLYSVGGIVGFIALFMLITVHRKEFKVIVYIKASTPIVSYRGSKGNVKNNTIKVTPGKEAKNLAHELGALLLEIKAGKYQ